MARPAKVERPDMWIDGPDPILHAKRFAFRQQKNQAQWRKEEWYISFEEWCALWTDEKWANKGRESDQYSMMRRDFKKAWTLDNVMVVKRTETMRARIQKKTKKMIAIENGDLFYESFPCKKCGATTRITDGGDCLPCYRKLRPNGKKHLY